MESDKILYTGDFRESNTTTESLHLRLLRSEDALPLKLTVVATKDRIVLKLDDGRAITCGSSKEQPQIIEGPRPIMTLETVDREEDSQISLFADPPAPQTRSGKGLTWGMMLREARLLMSGRNLKRASMRVFLILLTVLTLLTTADYIAVSHIDPQDFITSDSHMLMLTLESGGKLPEGSPPSGYTWGDYYQQQYRQQLADSGLDFDFVPTYSIHPQYAMTLFYQQDDITLKLPAFSYVSLDRLDPADLLWGRMPENSEEIVADRIFLDAMLKSDSIVRNAVTDLSFFLGESLDFGNKGLNPTIVGICDSGERSLYMTDAALCAMGNRGVNAISLSELRQRFPGQYDDLVIEPGTCIANIANAGIVWEYRIGQDYGYKPNQRTVVQAVNIPEISAHIIVPDEDINAFIMGSLTDQIPIYCADKAAMRTYLAQETDLEANGYLTVSVTDVYALKYEEYAKAAHLRADARTIITATVLVICLVMLYLLCRTQVQERLGLIAVYRLLGIPKGKLRGIFLTESLVSALGTVVPSALLTWLAVFLLMTNPDTRLNLLLPWQAAAIVSGCILGYYILVSLLPLARLLRLPPAQLAAKYDI